MEYVLNVITIEQFPAIGTITDYLVWGKFYNDMVRCVCVFLYISCLGVPRASSSLWLDTFSFGKCLANISSDTDSASFFLSFFQVSSYMYTRSFSSHLICFFSSFM